MVSAVSASGASSGGAPVSVAALQRQLAGLMKSLKSAQSCNSKASQSQAQMIEAQIAALEAEIAAAQAKSSPKAQPVAPVKARDPHLGHNIDVYA